MSFHPATQSSLGYDFDGFVVVLVIQERTTDHVRGTTKNPLDPTVGAAVKV
jgi:hypothetical protein